MESHKMSRKNRRLLIISCVITFFIVVYFGCGITGICRVYKISTSACEPKYEVGERIFSSNLKTIQKGEFVCYTHLSGEVYTSQLIAMEGDVLEIKNNIAYINGSLDDDTMKLKFAWIVEDPEGMDMATFFAKYPGRDFSANPDGKGGNLINLTINEGQTMGYKRWCFEKGVSDKSVWMGAQNNWNRDWFGPFTIPKGYVFLLSPNRANAYDSRYRGPIEMKNIVAVNLN